MTSQPQQVVESSPTGMTTLKFLFKGTDLLPENDTKSFYLKNKKLKIKSSRKLDEAFVFREL